MKIYLLFALVGLCFTCLEPVQARLNAASTSRDLATTKSLTWSTSVFSSSPKSYVKGTKLVLNYSGFHDVWRFPNKAAWAACDFSGATQICGTTVTKCTITLNTVGNRFYGCNVGSHCSGSKMKLLVKVTTA